MRFLIRLLGALWLATLIVSAAFAWYEVHRGAHAPDRGPPAAGRPRRRRRARGLRAAGGARRPHRLRARAHALRPARPRHRHLRRLRLGDRRHRVDVKRSLGPISPLVTDAIQQQRAHPRLLQGGTAARRWCTWCRCSRTTASIGAAAVLLDAEIPRAERVGPVAPHRRAHRRPHAAADRHHLDRRALVGHPADGPHRRVDAVSLKSGQPLSPPPEADAGLFGSLATEVTGPGPHAGPRAAGRRRGGAAAAGRRQPVDGGAAQAVRRDPVRRATDLRRVQPRAGEPRAARAA